MTKSELNTAIKKLYKNIGKGQNHEERAEFVRLHGADKSMKSLTAKSLRMMIDLNRRFNFIPPHQFGIFIEI